MKCVQLSNGVIFNPVHVAAAATMPQMNDDITELCIWLAGHEEPFVYRRDRAANQADFEKLKLAMLGEPRCLSCRNPR